MRATNWLGDAVMSLPALEQLRLHNPGARISILARTWVGALYARESFCDEVIPYEAEAGWRGLTAKVSVAKALGARGFDCALLLQNAFEAAALVWMAQIPVRIGYDRDARGWLLTNAVPVPADKDIPKHQRFYYLELLKRAGLIPAYDRSSPIRLTGAKAAAGPEQNVIGVSPGAAYGGAKRWLPDRFAEAAIQVARETHCTVLVMGSQAEYDICEQVHRRVCDAGIESTNRAGKTRLNEFIESVATCRLILTNDSGAMHIASALGIPTVAVFGATDDEATGPTGPLSRVVRHAVECSPCLLRECPIDHRCMTRVDATRVAQTALEVLHAR